MASSSSSTYTRSLRAFLFVAIASVLATAASVPTPHRGGEDNNNHHHYIRHRSTIIHDNTDGGDEINNNNNNHPSIRGGSRRTANTLTGNAMGSSLANNIEEMCNLCHSITNDAPYPLPELENRTVSLRLRWGTPEVLGTTCLEVWNHVLDFGTGSGNGVGEYQYDMATCRLMAREYAPQCCNRQADLPQLMSSDPSRPENHGSRNLRRT